MSAPRPRPVPARLLERALAAPDSPLCVVPERVLDGGLPVDGQIGWWRVTVGEAALQVAALADALETAGVVASDRVGVLAGSSHTWAVLDLAIQALGAITVGLSPELGVEELRRRLALTGARLLVTDRTVAIPGVTRLGMPGTPGTPLQPGTAPDLDRLAARLSAIDVDQPAALAFTAGTTAPARAAGWPTPARTRRPPSTRRRHRRSAASLRTRRRTRSPSSCRSRPAARRAR